MCVYVSPFTRVTKKALAEAPRVTSSRRLLWESLRLNRYPVKTTTPEMILFLDYVQTLQGLHAFRTEWMIYAEKERLAGSIDFVARDTKGQLHIFDWKRSKEPVRVRAVGRSYGVFAAMRG